MPVHGKGCESGQECKVPAEGLGRHSDKLVWSCISKEGETWFLFGHPW